LNYNKSVQNGTKDSFAHMSLHSSDAPQGAFVEISEISFCDISCIITKERNIC